MNSPILYTFPPHSPSLSPTLKSRPLHHHPLHPHNHTMKDSHTRPLAQRRQSTSYVLRGVHSFTAAVTRNIQLIALLFGLVVTALVQPLFVTFMILLWIGDEAFKAYFMKDIIALLSFSKPTGSVFELVMKWSTMSFIGGIACLLVCLVAYLKWKDQQNRSIFSLIASQDFNNKLKPYFIVYYSAWLLIYWFEITVIFFGYIGKLALLVYGTDTVLEVNAEHNFIGLCFLVLFVILITLADFIVQDIFNLRSTAPEVRECQRQE